MITKNSNTTKWKKLFQDAWQELSQRGDLENENPNQTTFTNLAHYFSYLEQLSEIDPIYIMLPIDEKPFEIDANTRKIEIPPDFLNCCEVQSDNYAEIITFTIDRYFDYKDLMETQIAVQWQNKAANTDGIDRINLIDLKTFGNEEKIRFGWPITKEMTAAAGNLEFVVRFFTQPGGVESDYEYLLSTLPTSIPIKSTLVMKEGLTESTIDTNSFKNFITNSQNPSYATPTPVVFQCNLPNEIYLDSSNTKSLKILAGSADGGNIVYDWYLLEDKYEEYTDSAWPPPVKTLYTQVDEYNYDPYPATGNVWPSEKPTAITKFYKKTSELIPLNNNNFSSYDIELNSQDYEIYDIEQNGGKKPILVTLWTDGEDGAKVIYTGSWPPPEGTLIYLKCEQLTFVDSDKNIIGTYYVKGTNRVVNIKGEVVNKSENYSNHCKINPPNRIEYIRATESQFFDRDIIENNKIEITLNSDEHANREFSIFKDGELQETGNISNNTISYPVLESGKYNINVKSTLNRATIEKQNVGGDIHFYEPAPLPTLNIDDGGLFIEGLEDTKAQIYNSTDHSIDFDAFNKTEYKLCISLATPSINNLSSSKKWFISLGEDYISIDKFLSDPTENIFTQLEVTEDDELLFLLEENNSTKPSFKYEVTYSISYGDLTSSKTQSYIFNTFNTSIGEL